MFYWFLQPTESGVEYPAPVVAMPATGRFFYQNGGAVAPRATQEEVSEVFLSKPPVAAKPQAPTHTDAY